MPELTTNQAPRLSEVQIDQILQAMADSFARQLRSPIMHAPSEQGLDWSVALADPAVRHGH